MTRKKDEKLVTKEKEKQKREALKKKVLEEAKEEIKKIAASLDADKDHKSKRLLSFKILDTYLNSCEMGVCPKIPPEYHRYLIDISVEGYITDRAYYYSIDKIGKDDKDRYLMACNLVNKIFTCTNTPTIKGDIFEHDKNSLNNGDINGAKRRKAFWAFLSKTNISHVTDYFDACNFIENILKTYTSKKHFFDDTTCKSWKDLWCKNLHMTNGVELFGYCFFRKCLTSTLPQISQTQKEASLPHYQNKP